MLVGGVGDQLIGGAGNDELVAVQGGASLSGGAGNDVLVNAGMDGARVTMAGGLGNDTFKLDVLGGSTPGATPKLNTLISDLTTTDHIDLSAVLNAAGSAHLAGSDLAGRVSFANSTTSINLDGLVVADSDGTANGTDAVHLVNLLSTTESALQVANALPATVSNDCVFVTASPVDHLDRLIGNLSDSHLQPLV